MRIFIPDDQADEILATLEICSNLLPEEARSVHKEKLKKLMDNIEVSKNGAVLYDLKKPKSASMRID